jgi:ABC-2 type transport system permease protein
MRNVITIARKELSIYFSTPWGWIGGAAMAFLSSFFFLSLLGDFKRVQLDARQYGWGRMPPDAQVMRNLTDGVVVQLMGVLLFITLIVAPFLAMRLFSEERKQKTYELLLTAPVRSLEIVLGKYVGGTVAIWSVLAITFVYPVALAAFGSSESGQAIEWSTVGTGYLALFLWSATCMGIGMFISALTESQMLAAILSLVTLLLWTALGALGRYVDEPFKSMVHYASFDWQLQNLMKGVLDVKSIVFFVSIACLSILFTHRAVEAQRWT